MTTTEIFDEDMIAMDIEDESTDYSGNCNITFTNGYKIEICQDQDAESPREWDNFTTMICWHKRYDLGDEQADPNRFESIEEIIENIKENNGECVFLPLYLYDHSGISISTSSSRFSVIDNAGWDWGLVGLIYASYESIKDCFMIEGEVTEDHINKAIESMVADVEVYDQYLRGDVYYYNIEDPNGLLTDGCGGFFGFDECRSEAISNAESIWQSILDKTPVQGLLFPKDVD
jgi:hypothetical protein